MTTRRVQAADDEPADLHQRSKAPGPCPQAPRKCTYPLCDDYCGAPPPAIFGARADG